MSKPQINIPLEIAEVTVLKTEINKQGELIITIESLKEGTRCHRCGQEIEKRHGHDQWIVIRYLPVFGRRSFLRYRPKRYYCTNCHATTTQKVEWHEQNSPNSQAYDEHILLQLVNSTIEDVRLKEDITYDCVLGALERQVASQVDWSRYNHLGVLGLDEIALKKGHADFVVIVTARLKIIVGNLWRVREPGKGYSHCISAIHSDAVAKILFILYVRICMTALPKRFAKR